MPCRVTYRVTSRAVGGNGGLILPTALRAAVTAGLFEDAPAYLGHDTHMKLPADLFPRREDGRRLVLGRWHDAEIEEVQEGVTAVVAELETAFPSTVWTGLEKIGWGPSVHVAGLMLPQYVTAQYGYRAMSEILEVKSIDISPNPANSHAKLKRILVLP